MQLYVWALKSFYKYLHRFGYPDLGIFLDKETTLPPEQRILTAAEYKSICGLPETDETVCVRFLCNTGLRASELADLTPENVSGGFLRVIGKGRRKRSIPLNKTALSIVRKYPAFEFVRCKNRLWLWRSCKDIGVCAAIPPFYPHSCRHYFANELYHRGVDMFTISLLLGHADTKVTENTYVHWKEEQIKNVCDVLD